MPWKMAMVPRVTIMGWLLRVMDMKPLKQPRATQIRMPSKMAGTTGITPLESSFATSTAATDI